MVKVIVQNSLGQGKVANKLFVFIEVSILINIDGSFVAAACTFFLLNEQYFYSVKSKH